MAKTVSNLCVRMVHLMLLSSFFVAGFRVFFGTSNLYGIIIIIISTPLLLLSTPPTLFLKLNYLNHLFIPNLLLPCILSFFIATTNFLLFRSLHPLRSFALDTLCSSLAQCLVSMLGFFHLWNLKLMSEHMLESSKLKDQYQLYIFPL